MGVYAPLWLAVQLRIVFQLALGDSKKIYDLNSKQSNTRPSGAVETYFLGIMVTCCSATAFAKLPRMIRVEATVNAPLAEVWQAWTISAGAETFFAPKVNIQLAIGGGL